MSFKPDFDSAFFLINGSQQRGFAGLYNLPAVSLKRSVPSSCVPFQLSEQLVELLSELIDLYTPHWGRVMDPYGVPLSTAIAKLQMNRNIICLEFNQFCFKDAIDRLRKYLPSFTENQK